MERVQFNWSELLCKEFLENFHEAQEQGKEFHYAWLLLSIVLMVGELPEDNQFPTIDRDLPEAAKYTSLWAIKDANRIRDGKIFWVFMEMNLKMGSTTSCSCHPLSTTAYKVLRNLKWTSTSYTSKRRRTRPSNG